MEQLSYEEKLKRAKEFLGTRWVLHPNNRINRVNLRIYDTYYDPLQGSCLFSHEATSHYVNQGDR